MLDQIYPAELQLNISYLISSAFFFFFFFFYLKLSISNGKVSIKIYEKWDDFDFDIVNFPFLDGDVPRLTSYRVYICQLIHFAKASSHI